MDMRFIYIELYKVATKAFKNYVYAALRSLFVSLFRITLSVLFYLSSFLWRTNSPYSATVRNATTKNNYGNCVNNTLLVLVLVIANNSDVQYLLAFICIFWTFFFCLKFMSPSSRVNDYSLVIITVTTLVATVCNLYWGSSLSLPPTHIAPGWNPRVLSTQFMAEG